MIQDSDLSKKGLPNNFGPNHPDWGIPSKMYKYHSACGVEKVDNVNQYTTNDNSGDILFCMPARLGDMIAASFIANRLTDIGRDVTWLTLPRYAKLVKLIAPFCKVRVLDRLNHNPEWGFCTEQELRSQLPGYNTHINAQWGAPENHSNYINSGKHPLEWLSKHVSNVIGKSISDNPLNIDGCRIFDYSPRLDLSINKFGIHKDWKVAIIASEAHTSHVLTQARVDKIKRELYKDKYLSVILLKERPLQPMADCVWGLSVGQCIRLIQSVDLYVGQDSGMSWCSLYSDCEKRIYHSKSRLEEVNTYFSYIDKNAKDIIVED